MTPNATTTTIELILMYFVAEKIKILNLQVNIQ